MVDRIILPPPPQDVHVLISRDMVKDPERERLSRRSPVQSQGSTKARRKDQSEVMKRTSFAFGSFEDERMGLGAKECG